MLIVISAPSGGGKTSLRNALRKNVPELEYSVSVTTRKPREGEYEGKDYFFVTEEVFRDWVEDKKFIEWVAVHGNLYGTPREFIEKNLRTGRDILLDVDTNGGLKVKQMYLDSVLIFIAPPSIAALKKRLEIRGTDTPQEVKKRLLRASGEIREAGAYDYVIVNENLEDAATELEALVRNHMKSGRGRKHGCSDRGTSR